MLGWVSVAGLALVIGISLNADRSRGTLLMVAGMAVLAVLLYAYLIRPRVRVRGDYLELVNPWTLTRIPLARVGLVLIRSVTFVYVGEKRYVGVAIGRTTRDMAIPASMRGTRSSFFPRMGEPGIKTRDREAETTERQITELARGADPAGYELPVTRTVSTPHLTALVITVVTFVVLKFFL